MQPLIVSQQITQGVADFLRAAFPATTPGFDGLIQRFLAGIRAGLYVGEAPAEESSRVQQLADGGFSIITDRNALRENPPDILLTNYYKLLDVLLIRAAANNPNCALPVLIKLGPCS